MTTYLRPGGKRWLRRSIVGVDQRSGLHGVGAGRKIDADRHRRLAVEAAFDVLVLGAELDAGDIADAQQRAVGIGAQHDIAKLLGRGQPALRLQVHLELLVVWPIGRAPMRPTGACTFCAWIAAITSDGVNPRLSRRCVSNQMRIE